MFKDITKMNSYIHVGMACTLAIGVVAFGSAWFWDKPVNTTTETHNVSDKYENNTVTKEIKETSSVQCSLGVFDLNNDGEFNLNDSEVLISHVRGFNQELCTELGNGNAANGPCNLNCDERITLLDINILSSLINGTLTEEAYFAGNTCTCESNDCFERGLVFDINGDGIQNENDARQAQSAILGLTSTTEAECNGNFVSVVTSGDEGICCPEGVACDLSCDGMFTVADISLFGSLVNGSWNPEEICGVKICEEESICNLILGVKGGTETSGFDEYSPDLLQLFDESKEFKLGIATANEEYIVPNGVVFPFDVVGDFVQFKDIEDNSFDVSIGDIFQETRPEDDLLLYGDTEVSGVNIGWKNNGDTLFEITRQRRYFGNVPEIVTPTWGVFNEGVEFNLYQCDQ